MKYSELNNKDRQELQNLYKEQVIELGKLRFESQSKALKDSSKIKKTRRTVARILTALKSK